MPFLLLPIVKETLGISLSTFKVTRKDKPGARRSIDKRSLVPFLILLALTLAGLVRMTYMLTVLEYVGVLAVMFWLLRNAYYLTMCLFLGLGRDTDGENVKVFAAEGIALTKNDGQRFEGITTKLTEHSVDIFTDEMDVLYLGEAARLEIIKKHYRLELRGTVVSIRHSCCENVPSVYTFEILDFGENRDEYIQMLYDRTPTLPQRLRLGDGYIRNFWKNFSQRIAVK
jgi:cellulose synthase (UDP-forming)